MAINIIVDSKIANPLIDHFQTVSLRIYLIINHKPTLAIMITTYTKDESIPKSKKRNPFSLEVNIGIWLRISFPSLSTRKMTRNNVDAMNPHTNTKINDMRFLSLTNLMILVTKGNKILPKKVSGMSKNGIKYIYDIFFAKIRRPLFIFQTDGGALYELPRLLYEKSEVERLRGDINNAV